MGVSDSAASDAERFSAMFDATSPRVFAYVRRHADRSNVEDIVAETFLIGWRKFQEVPPEPLPWLLVVARNVLANERRRSQVRQKHQASNLMLDQLPDTAVRIDEVVVSRQLMAAALSSLSETYREALLLTAWDGLSTAQAANVVGCSEGSFRIRLMRARRRLDSYIAEREQDTPRPFRATEELI